MSLEEKAKEYALKALESEIEKVQKAYIDGYNAAKANEPFIDENGIKWYDMDLPSGNLWSEPLKDEEGNLLEVVYNEAAKYDIPTKEDKIEFVKMTQQSYEGSQYKSINGKIYHLPNDGDYKRNFWLKSDRDNDKTDALTFTSKMHNVFKFKGDKVCVVLIKRKN